MTEEINELKAASLRLGEEIRATLPDRHSSVISEVKKRSNVSTDVDHLPTKLTLSGAGTGLSNRTES